jgi:hypothetical protein
VDNPRLIIRYLTTMASPVQLIHYDLMIFVVWCRVWSVILDGKDHFHYLWTIKSIFKIINHHKKPRVSMYYPTIFYPCPIQQRSDSTPFLTSKRICICNRICVISAPLHIRQKNMDVDVENDLFDPLSSLPITSQSQAQWPKAQTKSFSF